MSAAPPNPSLDSLDDWLPELDHTSALQLAGSEACERAVSGGFELRGEPTAIGAQVVQAEVAVLGEAQETSVGMGTSGELACRCSCPNFSDAAPCEHVAGLLLTLAESDELRQSLLGLEADSDLPTDTESLGPDARRMAVAHAREHGVEPDEARYVQEQNRASYLDATFQGWRRRGKLRPLGQSTIQLAIEPPSEEDPTGEAALRVRIRPKGENRPFGPDDLESRRLPAREWRLLEPMAHSASGTKEFRAQGEAASRFIERAAEAGVELHDEGGDSVLSFSPSAVRPALRIRTAREAEIAAHPMVASRRADTRELERGVHQAWIDFNSEGARITERDFRELIGLDTEADESALDDDVLRILEAVWIPADASSSIEAIAHPLSETVYFPGPTNWVYLFGLERFARVAPDVGPIALARLCSQPHVVVEGSQVSQLPALLREHFQSEGVVLPTRAELGLPPLPAPRIVLRVTGSTFLVEARLEAMYGRKAIPLTAESCAPISDDGRDGDAERAAVELLETTVLNRRVIRPKRRGRASAAAEGPEYLAEGDNAVTFWTTDLPRLVGLAARGSAIAEVVVPPALRSVAVRAPVESTLVAKAPTRRALDVALHYAADGVEADIAEIREAIAAKRRWVRLTDGSVSELSERVAALVGMTAGTLGDESAGQLASYALGEAADWADLADHTELDETVAGWRDRLRALSAQLTPDDVPELQGKLRTYQETGVAWLQFLSELGAGGVLADDMGLGKTIQTLALLAWRRATDGPGPSLVITPTSVATNWIREAGRFVPELKCLLLHGADRHERYDDVLQADIAVTTYALLRRDLDRLKDIPFRYVILDEAQHIKNHRAATTAAAKSLQAEARLGLTGTPIENRLLELWSILDFCNPGMLGTWRSFARQYERAAPSGLVEIDAEPSTAQPLSSTEIAALRARIRPFVLRRTKGEVERDLPPKIQSNIVVELTPAGRKGYAALAAAAREDVQRRVSEDGFERSRMAILTALLRLRQMACDPRLVDPHYLADDSAKLGAFRELVQEVTASGRRALVFSQFVELLTLVRKDLEEQEIEYAYLDGRTRDRDTVVRDFMEGDMPVFLLSLRAGGTGLNLAAADVVIHLDPWWNPAVEDQATDRAHRIGQNKTVSVYRIVAAGTIEEAILRMKEEKRALASAVIDDDPSGVKKLTEEDVEELLSFTG